jgi:hypothetical protein
MGPSVAPIMPVRTTAAAVSDGSPPWSRLNSTAMAVVTDLAASDSSTGVGRPASAAMPSTDAMVAIEPTSTPTSRGSSTALRRPRWV